MKTKTMEERLAAVEYRLDRLEDLEEERPPQNKIEDHGVLFAAARLRERATKIIEGDDCAPLADPRVVVLLEAAKDLERGIEAEAYSHASKELGIATATAWLRARAMNLASRDSSAPNTIIAQALQIAANDLEKGERP